jgi:heat shock protein HslJ
MHPTLIFLGGNDFMKWTLLTLLGTLVALLMVGAGPAAAEPEAALTGTYWRAVTIDGSPAAQLPQKREAHMMFNAEGKRVSGSTGCNRFTGTFTQTGDSLNFSPLAVTKMACPPALTAQERAFLSVLQATTAMHLAGNTLELKDAAGKVRLRLEACSAK